MKTHKEKNINIYEVIRETHDLKKYCESCGLNFEKIGTSYRANSPFTQGNKAFEICIDTPDIWHDFSLTDKNGGDIVEFSALINHNGDKRAALLELAPEGYSAEIDKWSKQRQEVQDFIKSTHKTLIKEDSHLTPAYMARMDNLIAYLESRGVNLEQIKRLMIGYTYNDNGRLVLPRVDLSGDFRYYRTRKLDGKEFESEEKYKCAYIGDNSFLKNIPLGLQTLKRESKYLALCEGDFDYFNFEREGFAVIGTGGGGGINKEILKLIRDNAEKFICGVLLAFDNDDAGKKFTIEAAKILFKYKITFHVAILPDNCKDINDYYSGGGDLQKLCVDAMPGLEAIALSLVPDEDFNALSRGKQQALKKDIKDFFIECRRAGVCECLIKRGLPEKWLAEIKSKSENGDSEYEISQHLQEQHKLLFNEKTGFYEYDTESQTWQQVSDTRVGAYVYNYLGHSAKSRKINSAVDLTKKAVESDIPIEKFNKLSLIPLKNGTMHINFSRPNESRFLLATPSDYVTSRLDYDFNNGATCDEWIKTLQEIFAGDELRINCLQEFCGYAWLPDCKFQKALYLRGDGSNGKSLILNVLKKIYGDKNYSSLELADLAKDFQRINLLYSLINISTEESANIKEAESTLKRVIAGETISGCYKQKDFIQFNPRAKFIFACNENLKISYKSHAMLRRFLLINCPVRFIDDEPEENNPYQRKKDLGLEARLTTPESLSGIFIWSMQGLRRLIKNGKFTETTEQAELSSAFISKTDSIDNFVAECNSEWQGKRYTRSEIYSMYLEYCENSKIYNTVRMEDNFFSAFNRALTNNKIPAKTNGQKHDGTRYYEFHIIQDVQ